MLSKNGQRYCLISTHFTTFSGVHVEKVKTNDNGYVYVDPLYKAMKHLYEDTSYRERIAKSGHQLFLDQYQASTRENI